MAALTQHQVSQFINDGFIRLDNAFSKDVAAECRALLWKATGCDPNDSASWTQPVIRIGEMGHEPFKKAANTPLLHSAFDQLAGKGAWLPRTTLGSFPIRFPSKVSAGDTGWHVDASFPGSDATNYMEWRINLYSKGRALLMLLLFSDVHEPDAPTRIRVGSHLDVAKILAPHGANGLSFPELAQQLDATANRMEVLATGEAGTVYLCHPFLVHAAQDHHGTRPKFMAQPPLHPAKDFNLHRPNHNYCPVEKAILKGVEQAEVDY